VDCYVGFRRYVLEAGIDKGGKRHAVFAQLRPAAEKAVNLRPPAAEFPEK
jgi:hypothetical protein